MNQKLLLTPLEDHDDGELPPSLNASKNNKVISPTIQQPT
jgi:hypothetical protein